MTHRIHYANGDVYGGDPYLAPRRGVLAIAQMTPRGQSIITREHYYWWDGQVWGGGDLFGLFDYLLEPGPRVVLFGRTVDTPLYDEAMRRAVHDELRP